MVTGFFAVATKNPAPGRARTGNAVFSGGGTRAPACASADGRDADHSSRYMAAASSLRTASATASTSTRRVRVPKRSSIRSPTLTS